ncbi:unnamed protein product, partial [Rotaria magnacalcarata]
NIGDQRLANCFEFNHHTNLDDLTLPYSQFERECSADYSFNTSISSASSITPTNSGMSSNYTYECLLYLFILLLCLSIHGAQ